MPGLMQTIERPATRTGWICALLSIVCLIGAAVDADERVPPRTMSRLAPARIEFVERPREINSVPAAFDPHSDSEAGRRENRELIEPPAARSPNALIDGVDVRVEPITALNIATSAKSEDGNQAVPHDFAVQYFSEQPTVQYGPAIYHEHFIVPSRRLASEFAYGPVYFEDRNLERHGTSFGRLQPIASAAHFFTRVPALPYLAAAEPPWNDYYPRDPYQPGRPAPHVRDWPEFDLGAATLEAGLAVGLIFLIP